jgi:hypothetical protein
VGELATDYFEASLASATSRPFAAHVGRCEGCQTYLRQLRITVDIVHTVADVEPVDAADLRARFRKWRAAGDADADSP